MKKVIVVIPVHKPDPTPNELASFEQCYKVLGSHPITIVAPSGLDMSAYSEKVPGCSVTFIDPHWMSDIRQYNKLKISKYFYNLFKDYEYLLTYELDAWVFRDELIYWCDKGYDYIGAPFFEQTNEGYNYSFIEGGNSGLSLRKVQSIISTINKVKRILSIRKLWYRSKLQGIIRFEGLFILEKILDFRFTKYFSGLYGMLTMQEDYYWSIYIPSTFPNFRISPLEEKIKFSFEVHPSFLFIKNGNRLPFGCHAWDRYEPEFWKQFINVVECSNSPS